MEQRIFPRIIQYMKKRHQQNENFPLSLEDILDELNINDLPNKVKAVLENEILNNNPKIDVKLEDGVTKYVFKPIFAIRNKRELLNFLKEQQDKGLGGVLLEDIQESLPRADDVIAKLTDEIVTMSGKGKKKVLFFNDKTANENALVDEDLVKYWRNVAVDGLDEAKIEDYLDKKNITSMKGGTTAADDPSNPLYSKDSKKSRKSRNFKRHNDHIALQEYNPDLAVSAKKFKKE